MVETAEVVAVIRAENGQFTREMNKTDRTIKDSASKTETAERQKQRSIDATAVGLGKVRLGWLAASGAAVAGTASFLRTSTILQGELGLVKDSVSSVADELVLGFGIDKAVDAATQNLDRFAQKLRQVREEGGGSIPVGVGLRAGAAASEGFDTGMKASPGERLKALLGSQVDLIKAVSLYGILTMDPLERLELISKSRGQFAGAITGQATSVPGAALDQVVGTASGSSAQTIIHHVTIDSNDEALKRALTDHILRQLQSNQGGFLP